MTPVDYIPLMSSVAKAAGQVALSALARLETMEVSFKGQADLLCEADEKTEILIRDRLTQAHPDIAFVGEETGRHGPCEASFFWAVDPIDGTTNFLSGLPFVVSLALVEGQTPMAGVIYAPLSGELFTGAIGTGAQLNGTTIRVRDEQNPARFVIGTGLPLDCHRHAVGAYERLHTIRDEVCAVRIVGTCALSLASVAAGRLDGYFEGPTGFLDCAAGVVLVKEAGGRVSDFWGTDDFAQNDTYVTGAPHCHRFLVEQTQQAPR